MQEQKQKRKIAINGFGRIGRAAFKVALENKNLEIIAINDLTDIKTLAHLLKYDSVYGIYKKKIDTDNDHLIVDDKKIKVLSEKNPEELPWKKMQIDVVIESTGVFNDYDKAKMHIKAGAKRVVISAPAKDEKTSTRVIGVNIGTGVKDEIISNASCTTNSLAPVAKIINDEYGIEKAMMTTIHSYTADQTLVDGPHKDLRRARAAAHNIIPTTTGAASATAKTIPDLENKFDGIAIRVPTICGSISDITFLLKKDTTDEKVNALFKEKIKDPKYQGIVDATEDPIVSSDIIGNSHSAIVDLEFTRVVGGNLLKILAWYDNEWAYSNRLIDVVEELLI
ncbi:MAG: type I glyceraldehyde-3-phosphate dehydrogenase [Parcubacteria group bacterium CG_4_10_14_0_2_um_filter_41_6]|nr:MAG: type I glyceraldehyde-3-phosphate dehydrogenase [Parcubacteria group bacterium CG_4_10_14_0_2_um_filter_41_6]